MTVEYLSIGQLLALHAQQLRRYGGGTGVRDRGALESALARPAATFGGEDLYPDIADKAAALMHSLALNHPFVDGNKRVAAFGAIVFAESNGHEFLATPASSWRRHSPWPKARWPSKRWRFGFANASAR